MQFLADKSPNIRDIAWAAGIYEGEGNIDGFSRTTQYLNIAQKDPWILYKMLELFGGKVVETRTNYEKYGKYSCWRWYCTGPRARGFAYTIYPFLSPRRQQQIRAALKLEPRLAKEQFND